MKLYLLLICTKDTHLNSSHYLLEVEFSRELVIGICSSHGRIFFFSPKLKPNLQRGGTSTAQASPSCSELAVILTFPRESPTIKLIIIGVPRSNTPCHLCLCVCDTTQSCLNFLLPTEGSAVETTHLSLSEACTRVCTCAKPMHSSTHAHTRSCLHIRAHTQPHALYAHSLTSVWPQAHLSSGSL